MTEQDDDTALFGDGKEDFAQADWLSVKMENQWRYDHTAKRWHHWDGYRWAPDDTKQVMNRVATLAGEALAKRNMSDNRRKALVALTSNPPIERALDSLSTYPGYGTNGDDWDTDPFLLGCENGIVDLRTNTLNEHPTPDTLVSKTTGVKFVPINSMADAKAEKFLEALDEWMSGNDAMVSFLLLWFGASLFGFAPEQRFLLMTGIGRNGKGALKHSVIEAVGDYGAQFDANLYMRNKFGGSRSESARADLMALKGKRLTFFSEPEGNRFNEEMLKAHTGGDVIAARALYSNNIQTWMPTHSITFLVNNAPEVEDLGPSMGARVMVANFDERYEGDKEDKMLYTTLKKEAEGILSILCLFASRWYQSWDAGLGGLTLPDRVIAQSKAFMERGDSVANALNDAFAVADGLSCMGQAAYDTYLEWHRASGDEGDLLSGVKFGKALERKGFKRLRSNRGVAWRGLAPLNAMALAEREGDDA